MSNLTHPVGTHVGQHVPATFVLAGINVENCGFFNGHRGEQLARRFTALKVSPSSYSTIPQRQEWALLVEGFERALRLHAHKPGRLLPLADYLYGRTGGYIVSLSHLIREAQPTRWMRRDTRFVP
jgi:hypothetical protein